MKVVLTYTLERTGTEEQIELEDDITEIGMNHLYGKGISHIDLSPLKSCRNLEMLILSQNNLKNIDLSPLSFCIDLGTLFISGNNLQNVNLGPSALAHNCSIFFWVETNFSQSISPPSPLVT